MKRCGRRRFPEDEDHPGWKSAHSDSETTESGEASERPTVDLEDDEDERDYNDFETLFGR